MHELEMGCKSLWIKCIALNANSANFCEQGENFNKRRAKKKKKRENDLLQVHMPLCTVDASVAGPGKAVEL